jgi:hypothetical protein
MGINKVSAKFRRFHYILRISGEFWDFGKGFGNELNPETVSELGNSLGRHH